MIDGHVFATFSLFVSRFAVKVVDEF